MTVNKITNTKELAYLLNITDKDITKSFMLKNFGDFGKGPKYDPSDEIVIPPGFYGKDNIKNSNECTTTIGLWVFNKYFIEPELLENFGYINHTLNSDHLDAINDELSYIVLEEGDKLGSLKTYLMKREWMMRFTSILSSNHTDKMLLMGEVMEKHKKELLVKYKDEIDKGNTVVAAKMEEELKKIAKDYLKDDPSMDIYDSKARMKFDNQFKNMFLMKGAIMNPDPEDGFTIATSALVNGISKEEYHVFANSCVASGYARAKNTQTGGYLNKQMLSAFQHVILDPVGSDCRTKRFITVTLTPKNIKMYMYNYIIEGNNLIELNRKNKAKYIGKTVKMRFSSLCESKTGICNKCMGDLYYKLGIKNVGMTTTKIASRVMNLSLKAMHNGNVKITHMNIGKVFGGRDIA